MAENLADNLVVHVRESGIIMEAPDGKTYEHQCGGMFMHQATVVGEFVSIVAIRGDAGNYCPTCGHQVFREDFDGSSFEDVFCMARHPVIPDDSLMDIIDKELALQVSERVKVDRERKSEITEAWIPVLVDGRKGIFVYENCD